ncbi:MULTISPECIES: DUF2939 domain-containing protein [unclassified Janthinobacterium]|uniref:DUF2939 domain-containing protein n=1 Tax=unclassified Janthinobacterium TaxID=2610881 RepID=UPI0018DC0A4F|nr:MULTISPECIES: DUF2939 domain-containing protein [unclassified Janthinobacterium]MDN2709590.1 DUF2939 domain-containing protein [Janthinobacterium sp. SUN118]
MLLLALVALVALAGVFYGSPYFTMNQIREATMDEDTQALAAHIDLDQLRGSLGSQLHTLFSAPEVADDIDPDVIDPLLDTMLMPEGIVALMKLNDRYEHPIAKVSDISGRKRKNKPEYKLHYTSWDSVVVQRSHSKSHIGELTLARDGLWRWKLVSVALPKNLLADA